MGRSAPTHDVHDYAPPAVVRATETFWSLSGPELDRDQTGLELGAYRGEGLLRVAPFIGRMIGIEADAADAAIGAARLRGRPGAAILPWNPPAIPFGDAAFDFVFADLMRPAAVWPDRIALWREAARVLKPDARLAVLAFDASSAAADAATEWTARLREAGFAVVEEPPFIPAAAFSAELALAGFEPQIETLGPLVVARAYASSG